MHGRSPVQISVPSGAVGSPSSQRPAMLRRASARRRSTVRSWAASSRVPESRRRSPMGAMASRSSPSMSGRRGRHARRSKVTLYPLPPSMGRPQPEAARQAVRGGARGEHEPVPAKSPTEVRAARMRPLRRSKPMTSAEVTTSTPSRRARSARPLTKSSGTSCASSGKHTAPAMRSLRRLGSLSTAARASRSFAPTPNDRRRSASRPAASNAAAVRKAMSMPSSRYPKSNPGSAASSRQRRRLA